ncbi:unnamed protein product (macronuclear) [Paramecium tetraurelia]|uniref:Uncharacterized protein n=1 Tax=Paramecium tetraurelia TaxID=5888 RepID=A0C3F1_PARTE|nr:uncharacterized protein GSPATT00034797001 [Paramecium tetraurelia]CAK65318.1 unnamed protein product [Paramecium tetraurelia]|eukprot:XP_001432715.1 hypothetical protein (macronuclear) [Paramecium tetraurelia strain d4-2]
MEFFEQFNKKEITEVQFVEQLQTLTTKIQKKSTLSLEQILQVNQQIDKIDDSCFNSNVELFIKFALYLSNRGVYELLYQLSWDKILYQKDNADANLLGLYIIKRVYHSENHKVLIIFLNDILRQQKTVEKKFVLLEIFVQILPKIEKREIHLAVIFPVILMVINEGLQKFLKYKQQQIQNDLNEDNKFTKLYMSNFQNWTVSFFKRIFDSIKKFPEIKAQSVAIRELYGIDTKYDYFDNQLSRKPEDPKLIVKHYILLFLSDLIQGILESEQSMKDSQLDPEIIQTLLKQANQMIYEIHDNKLEIIENYINWIRFSIQFDQELPQQYQHYSSEQTYNPAFVCYLTRELLTTTSLESILTVDYKLKILIGVLYEQKKLSALKCDIQTKLIDLIVKYLNLRDVSIKLRAANHFTTPFDIIIMLIMEKAGSGLADETPYLSAWKQAQSSFLPEVWTRILEQCINKSQNYVLLSHLVNHFRSAITKLDNQILLKIYDILIQAIYRKEIGNIDAKVLLFDSATLLIQQLILKKADLKKIFDQKWKPLLKKYEKDLQSSIDYLEARKKEGDEQKLKDDQVFQSILGQERNLKIAYYNLSKVLE